MILNNDYYPTLEVGPASGATRGDLEVIGDSGVGSLTLRDTDVVISSGVSLTVGSLTVEGGVTTTVGGAFHWSAEYGATNLNVKYGATLSVTATQFSELIKADRIVVDGLLAVDGGASWKTVNTLLTQHSVVNLQFTGAVGNISNFNILKGKTFRVGALAFTGTAGNDTIKTGEFADAILDGDLDLYEGRNRIEVGANSYLRIGGDALNVGTFKVAAGKTYRNVNNIMVQNWTTLEIAGNATGSFGEKCELQQGAFSTVTIDGTFGRLSDYKYAGRISVGGSSRLTINGSIHHISRLELSTGKVYMQNTGAKVQGYTEMTGGPLSGTDGNDTIKFGNFTKAELASIDFAGGTRDAISLGNYSSLIVNGNILNVNKITTGNGGIRREPAGNSVLEYGSLEVSGVITGTTANDTVKIGKYMNFELGSVLLAAGNNMVQVGTNSRGTIQGNLSDVLKLELSNGQSYTDPTNKNKIQGYTTVTVTGAITATDANDTIKIGSYAILNAGSIELLNGRNQITIGGNGGLNVTGNLSGLNQISVGNGMRNPIHNQQFYTQFRVDGVLYFGDSLNTFKVGNYAQVNLGTVRYGDWANTTTIGVNSRFNTTGDLLNLNELKLSNGTKRADNYQEIDNSDGNTITVIGGNIIGTNFRDTIAAGNRTRLTVKGNISMGDDYDKLVIGNNSYLRLNGQVSGFDYVKIGSNVLTEASTQAIAGLGSIIQGGKSRIFDIGSAGEVANAFSTIAREQADDTLSSSVQLGSNANGWLSNKAGYQAGGQSIETYTDLVDFFKVDATYHQLDNWQIVGKSDSLSVKVWYKTNSGWSSYEIAESGNSGVWDLSSLAKAGITDYRISVAIGWQTGNDVYGYKVQLA